MGCRHAASVFRCLQCLAEHANGGLRAGLPAMANGGGCRKTAARSRTFRRVGISDYSGVDAGGRKLGDAAVHPAVGRGQAAAVGHLRDDDCRSGRVYWHPERKQIR
ncbi:hypothetical protein L1887_45316 [Cichorium endivia]|nr:hypothetical protein L1887_45316 [Cichorium endivia]